MYSSLISGSISAELRACVRNVHCVRNIIFEEHSCIETSSTGKYIFVVEPKYGQKCVSFFLEGALISGSNPSKFRACVSNVLCLSDVNFEEFHCTGKRDRSNSSKFLVWSAFICGTNSPKCRVCVLNAYCRSDLNFREIAVLEARIRTEKYFCRVKCSYFCVYLSDT